MKKKIIISLSIAALALIIYLNYYEDNKNKTQSLKERVFTAKIDSVTTVSHQFAFTDQLLANGNIYLKDYSNQQIIEIDYQGQLINKYGSQGPGPKENQMIRGFYVDEDFYYTSDANKNTLSKINMDDGELAYYFKLKDFVGISGFLSSGKVVVKGRKVIDKKYPVLNFTLAEPSKNKVSAIDLKDVFDINTPNSNWIYDGSFVSTNDGGLIYIPFYNATVIKFDNQGAVESSFPLIYQVPPIKLKTIGDMTVPESNDTPHFYSATANSKHLFLMSAVIMNDSSTSLSIDIYQYDDWTYLNSIKLERNLEGRYPNGILVDDDNKLIMLYEQSFSIYQIENI